MANEQSCRKLIILKTADDKNFEVDEKVAMEFGTVKSYIEDDTSEEVTLPLPNVNSWALDRIIEYCSKMVEFEGRRGPLLDEDDKKAAAIIDAEIKEFQHAYDKSLEMDEIKEVIITANYLNVEKMKNFLHQRVADRIKNKSVEYARKFFNVESDYTKEEEDALRKENAWAFEGVDED